jgi:hypothetical protein
MVVVAAARVRERQRYAEAAIVLGFAEQHDAAVRGGSAIVLTAIANGLSTMGRRDLAVELGEADPTSRWRPESGDDQT